MVKFKEKIEEIQFLKKIKLCKKIIKVLQVKHNNGEDQRLYPMKRNLRNQSYF